MKKQTTQLAAAVGAACLALGGAAQAQTAITPAAQPLKVEVSGQVSRALMYADDGVQKKTFNVDNKYSGTRFRLSGSAGITPQLRAGTLLEWDYQSNDSSLVTMAAPSVAPVLAERYLDAWFEYASWGRLHIGQGDGAANAGVEVDLSGTGYFTGAAAVTDLGGALSFRNSATGALGPTITAVTDRMDFESRYDRVMYVTPTFGGFRGQISNGTKDTFSVSEAALWYAGKLGALGDLAAALGYSVSGAPAGASKEEVMGGSISWLHTSGFNLTYAHSRREVPLVLPAAREGKFDYFKIGYKRGRHAVGVDYALGKDQALGGDEAKTMGVGYVWTPISWADVYAAYKKHSLDRPGTGFEDLTLFTVGTRLKF